MTPSRLRLAGELANRRTGRLLAVGLVGIALLNWRAWRRDKAFRAEKGQPWPPLAESFDLPKVSVLVAAWNEAENIERHIRSFKSLRYPQRELILCAGGTDGTYGIACRHAGPNVVVLEQQLGEGKQRALSRDLEHATGQIIFLTDADCLLDDDCFERTLGPVIADSEAVATGSNRPLDEQVEQPFVRYQWYYHAYCAARRDRYIDGLEGRNMVIRRELLSSIGEFGASVHIGTDYHLACQLKQNGSRIRYVPESEVYTDYPTTWADYWQQQSRWHRNIITHGLHFRNLTALLGEMQQGLIALFMLGAPLVAFLASPLVFSVWLVLFLHGLTSRIRYTTWSWRTLDSRSVSKLPWQKLVILMQVDFVGWVAGWKDLLNQQSRLRW